MLDHERRAGRAEPTVEHVARGRARLVGVRRDDDALARREPVRFDDDVAAEPRDRRVGLRDRARDVEPRGGNVMAREELLRERLRAFESRTRGARTERRDAGRAQLVGEPGNERRLGTDDGEIDARVARELDQAIVIVDADRHAARARVHTGIAGRRDELVAALREPPRQRVLAAAAADDQDPHAANLAYQCLKWRMPVNSIARSCSSAAAMTSSSRTEPPGCTTARAPAAASTSTPSRNGRNASDATTAPLSASPAFRSQIRTESMRLIWPAPIATVTPPLANTIALDLTCLATRHANARSMRSASLGARVVATLAFASSTIPWSTLWTSAPPAIVRT